eukprot:PhF_6_TR20833/c0_g1_i2/m.29994
MFSRVTLLHLAGSVTFRSTHRTGALLQPSSSSSTNNINTITKLPIVLSFPQYSTIRALVNQFVKDKSELARIRALSSLSSYATRVEDPTHAKGLLDVYHMLGADDMAPDELKAKIVTEENAEYMLVDRAVAMLQSIHIRAEGGGAKGTPRLAKELSVRSEDALYELAQSVPSMTHVEFATFLGQFQECARCPLFDLRAMRVLLNEIKGKALTAECSCHRYILFRMLHLLDTVKDFDAELCSSVCPLLIDMLPEFTLLEVLKIAEYFAGCTGFEDEELFVALLDHMESVVGSEDVVRHPATLPRCYLV